MRSSPVDEYLSQYPKGKITRKEVKLRELLGEMLMDQGSEAAAARRLIERIPYITIATANRKAMPWNSPVFCAYDGDYNFYWISSRTCVHSVNIAANPNVALVIYDSTQPEGKGFGVYLKAKASAVHNKKEIRNAIGLLYRRKGKRAPRADEFSSSSPRNVYKARVLAAWVNDLMKKDGELRYLRMEIDLKK